MSAGLLADPTATPLFLHALGVLAAALGGSGALLAALGLRLGAEWRGTLWRRWLTWLVIGPLYALALLAGQAATLALASLAVVLGLREYARLVALPPLYTRAALALGLALGPLVLWSREAFLAAPPLLLLLATLPPLLTQDVRAGARHLAFTAFGLLYLPWLLGHLLLLYRWQPQGVALLLALGLAVALSDVGAFTVGSLLGRRRLAPAISPLKTWEGALGNLVGAYLGFALLAPTLAEERRWLLLAALPPVAALGALWGDLLESLLKRCFSAKDAGSLLPGMGGVLDRVDSLVVAAPLTWYALLLIG